MATPTPRQIEDCIVRAIKSANRAYENLSGGEWVSQRGVESFVAYFVATALAKNFVPRERYAVLMEVSINELERKYVHGKPLRGRRGKGRYKGNRVDIVVIERIDEKWHAVGLVELKRNEFFSQWGSDVKRVSGLIRRYGPSSYLQWGCFAAFACESRAKPWICRAWKEEWRPFLKKQSDGLNCHLIKPANTKFKRYEGDDDAWRFEIVGGVYGREAQ
jgi:hypothetical protein